MTTTEDLPTSIKSIQAACTALHRILLFSEYASAITDPNHLYDVLGSTCSILQYYSSPDQSLHSRINTTLAASAEEGCRLLRPNSIDEQSVHDITGYRKVFLSVTLPNTIGSLALNLLGECRPHLIALDRGDTPAKWTEMFNTAKSCWEANPLRYGTFGGEETGLLDQVMLRNPGAGSEMTLREEDYVGVYEPARRALMRYITEDLRV